MKKKLIEVALPLEAINIESSREKSIRHGHPSTLHLWWSRKPLSTCRAVLFASLVDDPSSRPHEFPTEADQDRERQRLFRLIEELVKWENSNNSQLLAAAYKEILKSTDGNPPPVYDPFCGGGSIPLEAQRLGLETYASDLNPVAVLITKALVEIPAKFAGQPPTNPLARRKPSAQGMWVGAYGLADDVRYYGRWMRDRAWERVGHLYPKVKLPKENDGEAKVIAWLWIRTVLCPNPACVIRMPLASKFILSARQGKKIWAEPLVDHKRRTIGFEIRSTNGTAPEGTVNRRGARCLACGTTVPFDYVRAEGRSGRMGVQLMAIVAEGSKGRIYLNPTEEQTSIAHSEVPSWIPDAELPQNPRDFKTPNYGMTSFGHLFTERQLITLTTLSDLVAEARKKIAEDGASSPAYVDAVTTYLGMLVSRLTNSHSSLALWSPTRDQSKNVFSRQALPMLWDFAEVNPFAGAAGDINETADAIAGTLESMPAKVSAEVLQLDAMKLPTPTKSRVVSTDPPYYDNIGYADLSDYFYVWLRRSLFNIYPELFSTILVPKKQELVATPYRFGNDKEQARQFFEEGFGLAFARMRACQNPEYPLTVYYAFKQSESDEDSDSDGPVAVASTGWETMLEGLLQSQFQVTATWPMRSERSVRSIAIGSNALASSIVLACRPRSESASITTRKDFLTLLKGELPRAVRDLQKGNIAPVDLAQAAIGPGMGVFSRYKKVLESDGSPMRVRTALGLINQTLDEVLSEQEGEFDPDTRWALAWFEQHAFDEGLYGEAEVLATAKALSVAGLAGTGILHSRAGKVRLLRRDELPENWNPSAGNRLTVWSVTQHLIRQLDKHGEAATATLAGKVGGLAETARDLAYRLYILSERKGWSEEAGYYNSLVVSWPAIAPKAFALS
jgi:putative DNA methylase